ncbi:hypothetical protein Nepgr_003997 [Nepenthes gracilis]|uniref:Uncharacterized protein n=1 Tax=Nepenthes gracilis TaxID=150966 RepID=A0AAD3XEI4_NEPGR|nr:hypothetical protein Nepgr_003997 [Nepenthes gracilis]
MGLMLLVIRWGGSWEQWYDAILMYGPDGCMGFVSCSCEGSHCTGCSGSAECKGVACVGMQWRLQMFDVLVLAGAVYGRCLLQCEIEPLLFLHPMKLVLYVLSTLPWALGRGRLTGVFQLATCGYCG